ncbi:MAG: murein biosynthesis integral membrane protein MurJ [Deltaproteobacteria bacterium]|nr:murein biosynthesis integral membrane protein MurJ [Deltaproteobacteria bacterium]
MSTAGEESSHLISRRAGVFGFFTLLSRIAGLARDVAIAHVFGTRMAADAFYVAFRIPNLLRRLLAEGALTMAFVPIFADYYKRSPTEGRRAADAIFTVLLIVLLLLVGIGVALAPWIVRGVAYGFAEDPEKFTLTVTLTRWMFPYLLLVSCMALFMGMLNTLKYFAAPAAAPIFLNLAMIAGALGLSRWFAEPTMGLAIGVLIGGGLQLAVQLPSLIRERMLPRLTLALRHTAVGELWRIMLPSIYGGAVYQLNVLVITLLASFLADGSVAYLWYADRVTEFPLGIFAVAIATASLPTLSDHAAASDASAFKRTVNFGLRVALAEAIPSCVGIILLAYPIVRALFASGAFTDVSTRGTVAALYFFAAGIPFVSGVRNLVPAFYALKDAKTPVKIATVGLAINAGAALCLMRPFAHQGLAMAMALASAVHFALLLFCLRRRLGLLGLRSTARGVAGIVLASAGMAAAVGAVGHWCGVWTAIGRAAIAWRLALVIGAAIIVYIPLLRWLAPPEARHIFALLHLPGTKSDT